MAPVILLAMTAAAAADGPAAMRLWPGGGVSVETDAADVAVNVDAATLAALPRPPAVSVTGEGAGSSATSVTTTHTRDGQTQTQSESSSIAARPLAGGASLIEVGGRRVLVIRDAAVTDVAAVEGLPRVDAVIAPSAVSWGGPVAAVVAALPRPPAVVALPAKAGERPEGVEEVSHNTVAIGVGGNGPPRRVALSDAPWQPPAELAALLDAKDTAEAASRAVFEPLSVAQMNHRPADGSHTPRWNAEHMRGRELLFFTQIFHAVDAAVPVLDENPAQMPPDYRAAHPQWSGAEEARRTRQVGAMTRRFAYLLDGLDLDAKAPGSRFWTPRALLKQMQRHYGEHTANVVKKIESGDWPAK